MELILAARPSLGSWLLRAYTWGRWSHSAIHDPQTGYVYDSTFLQRGVRATPLALWEQRYPSREARPLPVHDEPAARRWLAQQLGKPYDWTALIGFVLRDRAWADDDAWFCSELTEAFRTRFGTPRFRAEALRVTPAHQDMLTD